MLVERSDEKPGSRRRKQEIGSRRREARSGKRGNSNDVFFKQKCKVPPPCKTAAIATKQTNEKIPKKAGTNILLPYRRGAGINLAGKVANDFVSMEIIK